MSKGRSDASTSTDDVKGRPLCLFYFTHPFGVLSPEPPTLAAAPPDIARAFINMEPVSPFQFWSTSTEESYKSTSSVSTRPSYDLGNTTVHKNPVNLVSVTKTRKCTVDFGSRRDSLASTLFSDMWFNSTTSSRSNEYARRVIPYNTILPPLDLPNNLSDLGGSDDVWPRKCLLPGKFSLPPIEMPNSKPSEACECNDIPVEMESVRTESVSTTREQRRRHRLGITKHRRRRYSDVRRLLTCLMRRAIKVDSGLCTRRRSERGTRCCRHSARTRRRGHRWRQASGSVKARATRDARTPQLEPTTAELCTLTTAPPHRRRRTVAVFSYNPPGRQTRFSAPPITARSTLRLCRSWTRPSSEARLAVVRAVDTRHTPFVQVPSGDHHLRCSGCFPLSGTPGPNPPRSSIAAQR